jgi:ABC-2 type transport system ATP-binding protein
VEYAVQAEGLTKRFGKTEALRGVDIEIERGTVLGVLGPNGAGKTTAVRILTTLIPPDEGRATIDGLDVVRDSQKVRARIGLTGQYAAVDERLTGQENLGHVGRLFHLDKTTVRQRSIELLDRFDLSDAADRVVKGYSGGMRRRLDIAMSLIGRPSVLFLDEPTTGLDPRSRAAMWELIDELVREGTTTLLTTQYLDEADRLANRIAVIDHGLVIAEGTSEELKLRSGGERLEVLLTSRDQLAEAVAVLGPFGHGPPLVDDVEPKVTIPLERSLGIVPEVVRALDGAGIKVEDVVVRRPTLDDVFFSLTGHAAEDEGVSDHGD